MTDTSKTDISFEAIAHGLGDRLLQVPMYQRSYAWEEEHVLQYFGDLQTAMKDKEPEYFLGSIVSTTVGGREEVVDGQQRLATTIILLSAIRDYFAKGGDAERAGQIERDYLFKRELRTQEMSPRLRLNDVDNQYFVNRILARPDAPERALKPTKASHERLAVAARLAAEQIAKVVNETRKPDERLADLVDYLAANVKAIWLRAPDTANAFVIFETLNDRGLDLAISDLLKNYLFLLAETRIAEVQRSWVAMIATMDSAPGESNVTEFIRHLWSSKAGATRERELYSAIKREIKTTGAAVKFANELEHGATKYSAMLSTEHAYWRAYGPTSRDHMGTMNLLGMVQIRPLLLAVLDSFSVAEARKTLRLFVAWGVRLLIVGGLGGGTMESHYADAAVAVRAGKISTAAGLRKALLAVIPGDAQFAEAFRGARVSKAVLARYYLRALERAGSGESNPELVPNANQDEINLEHILPKVLGSGWSSFDDETHRGSLTRLGNLVLLKAEENSLSGNSSFAAKKLVFKSSKFALTKMVARLTTWSPEAIEKRQDALAKLAVSAWPLK